jgi:F-type H+-transporting ATPase subunit b
LKATRVVASLVWAAALVLVASAPPAGASEETVGSCMVTTIEELGGAEAVEAIFEAGEAEGASDEAHEALVATEEELELCLNAPNPILPELNEIIWGGLAFLILLALMIRYGFPAVRKTMEARSERIRTDLQAAQAGRVEVQNLQQQLEAELAESKANAAKVLDQARQEALILSANLQVKAEADASEIRQRATAEVEAARSRALADLQSDVAEIVVGAAGMVVERNLDVDTHRQLINQYIANVGRQ